MLRDTRWFSVFGGRPDAPRSLASVHAAAVLRFVGAGFCGKTVHAVHITPVYAYACNGVAVSHDGANIFLLDSYSINVHSVQDGRRVRVVGTYGSGPLHFSHPSSIYAEPHSTGSVFVADSGNKRIQVLSAGLDFLAFMGVGQLAEPWSVCADADFVYVGDWHQNTYDTLGYSLGRNGPATYTVVVFERTTGTVVRRLARGHDGGGTVGFCASLCVVPQIGCVAVQNSIHKRIQYFQLDGGGDDDDGSSPAFETILERGEWVSLGLACTAAGEIVALHNHEMVFVAVGANAVQYVATHLTPNPHPYAYFAVHSDKVYVLQLLHETLRHTLFVMQ
jgi:hypothetical protein